MVLLVNTCLQNPTLRDVTPPEVDRFFSTMGKLCSSTTTQIVATQDHPLLGEQVGSTRTPAHRYFERRPLRSGRACFLGWLAMDQD